MLMKSKKKISQSNHINSSGNLISAIFLTVVMVLFGALGIAQEAGEKLFKKTCVACHTINKGRLVGPDLAGVHEKRPIEWLLKYVKSSQTMIKSGDEYANSIYNEYNQILMPDQPFSDQEIKEIIAYIGSESAEEVVAEVVSPKPAAKVEVVESEGEPVEVDRVRGQNLFAGLNTLKNKGPSCISCHNVNNDALISGGMLAKDLTKAYTRLTASGVKAILSNPPFPKMASAYNYKKLTDSEVADIAAFLQYTDEQSIYQHNRDYGVVLLWAGIPGAVTLLIIFYFLWFNRRRGAVNHEVFDRQLRTS